MRWRRSEWIFIDEGAGCVVFHELVPSEIDGLTKFITDILLEDLGFEVGRDIEVVSRIVTEPEYNTKRRFGQVEIHFKTPDQYTLFKLAYS